MSSCVLFDQSKVEVATFHIVFVLDESGSMSGSKWQELMNAYYSFLTKRTGDQGRDDVVSGK